MIPQLIQKRGAVHLEDEEGPANGPGLNPPRSVVELVPESVARENVILPIRLDGETLYVASADPSNILVADKLGFILNKKIRFVPFPLEQIQEAINRFHGQTETQSVDSMLVEFNDTAIESTQTEARTRRAPGSPPARAPSPVQSVAVGKGGV